MADRASHGIAASREQRAHGPDGPHSADPAARRPSPVGHPNLALGYPASSRYSLRPLVVTWLNAWEANMGSTSGGIAEPALPLIPPSLEAAWGDLPALAWLAARRAPTVFSRPTWFDRLGAPVIAVMTFATFWPARAHHYLAARGRSVVAVVTPGFRSPPKSIAWSIAVIAGSMAALSLIVITAGPAVAHATGSARAGALTDGVMYVLALCILPAGMIRLVRHIKLGRVPLRREALALSAQNEAPLVCVSALAAREDDRQATTVLARALLELADSRQLALMAEPADARLARIYSTLRFRTLVEGDERVLLRLPRRPAAAERQ